MQSQFFDIVGLLIQKTNLFFKMKRYIRDFRKTYFLTHTNTEN